MEPINGTFEKKYRSSGCLFAILGTLMVGLMLIIVLASLDQAKVSPFDWQVIPVFFFLACVVYFCFSRCFPKISIGIYPTYIIINNKKFPWSEIKHITFEKRKDFSLSDMQHTNIQTEELHSNIYVDFNNEKYVRSNIIVLSVLIILGISLIIVLFSLRGYTYDDYVALGALPIILPAMFGINIKRPKSRGVSVDPNDSETVFHLLKYYADFYQIPLEYKEEKK